jgi:hypothetical protein
MLKRKRKLLLWTLVAACLTATGVITGAATLDSSLGRMAMLGVRRSDGMLLRYDFASMAMSSVGTAASVSTTFSNIQGAGYVPGFQNIYGFWTDPSDSTSKLVYIDIETGETTIIADVARFGLVKGSTVVPLSDESWSVFALLTVTNEYPEVTIGTGTVKYENAVPQLGEDGDTDYFAVNVNNAGASITVETKAGGSVVYTTMPAVVGNEVLDANGFLIRLMSIDGNTYLFSVTVVSASHDLSHITFDFGAGSTVPSIDSMPIMHLVHVDHQTGELDFLMPLDRRYDSLATVDGETFYASEDDTLYRFDITGQTITVVGVMPFLIDVDAMEFADGTLYVFDDATNTITAISLDTALPLTTPANIGFDNVGSIVFLPLALDPTQSPDSFD